MITKDMAVNAQYRQEFTHVRPRFREHPEMDDLEVKEVQLTREPPLVGEYFIATVEHKQKTPDSDTPEFVTAPTEFSAKGTVQLNGPMNGEAKLISYK